MNLDILQGSLWTITYILCIIYCLLYKFQGIHLFAISLNYAWELNALIDDVIYKVAEPYVLIHILWLVLDLIILLLALYYVKDNRRVVLISVNILFLIPIMDYIFYKGGMLVSSFTLDFVIATTYYFLIKNKQFKYNKLALLIALTKMFGSAIAWIYYSNFSNYVHFVGFVVLILNLKYILVVMKNIRNQSYVY